MITDARHPLVAVVEDRFGGVLSSGLHEPDGKACIHEALNAAEGRPWSDEPGERPDLRAFNDGPWSDDAARTAAMLRIGTVLLWDWPSWSPERRQQVVDQVVEGTIRSVLPLALRAAADVHPDPAHAAALRAAADRCASEGSAEAAWAADAAKATAEAAWAEAARAAARAAWAAARAARAAAEAAWAAARAAPEAADAAARAARAAAEAARDSAAAVAPAAAWAAADVPMFAFVDVVEEACRAAADA